MTTNYDPLAEQYQRSKQQSWRTFIESFTLLDLIGSLQGQDVLDLACGEGFYTRRLRQHGASKVLGVDLSPGMIALARKQELEQGLGIEYVVGDACDLPATHAFDLAIAAYLLNYARNRNELQRMCDAIARSLKPGGRFVTVNSNPVCDFSNAPSYRQYGFETSATSPWQEGTPVKWTFYLEGGAFDIENYHLNVATHEDSLRQAGFRDIRWHKPRLSPEGLTAHAENFWSTFLECPPVTFMECSMRGAESKAS